MKKISYYTKIWGIMAKNSFLNWSANRNVFLVFLFGKIIRYVAYFGFLYFLVKGTNGFLGYSQNQILFFTATYVFIDTVSQFFFRNVYSFRPMIVSGDFDLVLVKPLNALFRVLMGGPDPIDLITIPPIIFMVAWIGSLLHPTVFQILSYVLLLLNGLIIAAAFHIFVLGFGIITLEVDHTIEIYRDLTSMGRFPIDIYKQPFQWILTFIIPIGVMVTFPAKAFEGFIGPLGIFMSLIFGIILILISLKFWNFALTKYTSASS
jgi:ABC-2 type transport system permease protein